MAVWRNPRAQNFNESLSKRGPNFKNAIFRQVLSVYIIYIVICNMKQLAFLWTQL